MGAFIQTHGVQGLKPRAHSRQGPRWRTQGPRQATGSSPGPQEGAGQRGWMPACGRLRSPGGAPATAAAPALTPRWGAPGGFALTEWVWPPRLPLPSVPRVPLQPLEPQLMDQGRVEPCLRDVPREGELDRPPDEVGSARVSPQGGASTQAASSWPGSRGPASLPQLPPGRPSWARHPKAVPTTFYNLPHQARANAGQAGAGQDPQAKGPPVGLPGPACSCHPQLAPSARAGEPPCLPGDGLTGGSGSGRPLGCRPGTGGSGPEQRGKGLTPAWLDLLPAPSAEGCSQLPRPTDPAAPPTTPSAAFPARPVSSSLPQLLPLPGTPLLLALRHALPPSGDLGPQAGAGKIQTKQSPWEASPTVYIGDGQQCPLV